MARKSKPQESCVFEFDRIEVWGPELKELFRDRLPKNLREMFGAEPPDDVEHAAEIVRSYLFMEKPEVERRMKKWFEGKRVAAYLGDRLTDAELELGVRYRSTDDHVERLRAALERHSKWAEVRHRVRDLVMRATPSNVAEACRRSASASRQGLLMNFNAYVPEGAAIGARVAFQLLGQEGLDLVHAYRTLRVFSLELLGINALRAANRFAGKRVLDPNQLVWDTFNAWAYWLADRDFSPADECWFVGLDLNVREHNYRITGIAVATIPSIAP